MKKALLTLFLAFLGYFTFSQAGASISSENLEVNLLPEGSLFTNNDFTPGFTTADGKSIMWGANLWYLGYDANENLRGAVEIGSFGEIQHKSGTINSDPNQASKPLVSVTSEEIRDHIQNYRNAGYTMPDGIKDWPANGDTTIGEMFQMAPFVDLDQDGIYDPMEGDHPDIIGDHCIYMIKHENGAAGRSALGVEEHYMFSLFNQDFNGSEELKNSLVLNLTLYHRGIDPIEELHVGFFQDGDLGNIDDDFIGSSKAANALFFYNADNDDDATDDGFGVNPPGLAIGNMFCNLFGTMSLNFDGNPTATDPETDEQFFNYLNGRWKDGTCQIESFNGHVSAHQGGDIRVAEFVFDGDIKSQMGWTEINEENLPKDQRGLMILKPVPFAPGDKRSFTLVYALIGDKGDHLDNGVAAIEALSVVEDELSSLYGNHPLIANSTNCSNIEIDRECGFGSSISQLEDAKVRIYPNPSKGEFYIQSSNAISEVLVNNLLGQEVLSLQNPESKELLKLEAGQYLIQVLLKNGNVYQQKVSVIK
ncbi:MAG: T9SS type A sorting domain-containing protein [Luteibaculum sp.]